MRIVKLNKNYLEEILKINGHINKKGIGLSLNIKDNFIFIPITPQIKYDSEKLKYLDYPLFNIGIALFKFINRTWVYVKFNHRQNIFNKRLRHIYINRNSILFIYNNRITEFSLENGDMIKNVAKRYAKNYTYQGIDISELQQTN